jgi:beta-glucanase (GH16 family)
MKYFLNFFLPALMLFTGCDLKNNDTTSVVKVQEKPEIGTIVWSDEFNGNTLDTTKWKFETGDHGWGNEEWQNYVEGTNIEVSNGTLKIIARKTGEGQKVGDYTSTRLNSIKSFTYGRMEIRAKMPDHKGKGIWPALWMLGENIGEVGWPDCGEIDIMESVGYEVDDETLDGIAHCTVHTPAYYFKINNQISSVKDVPNIAGEYHTYAVEWTPTEIRGFVDGEEYYLYDKTANDKEWPFNIPQDIIINLAMGGGWGGAQGMDPDITSQKIIFDYVRVYGKN